MKHQILILWLICAAAASPALALTPLPAEKQSASIALVGGTIHIGDGNVIAEGIVTFDQGRIERVGADFDTSGYQVFDITGQHVYPGFILPDSRLGLYETSSVRATIDSSERGEMNPSIRSLIAYNTDSEIIPTLRFNGILTAEIAPRGGIISGQSSVVQLDAWNWEDAAISTDSGVHLNWPPRQSRQFSFATFQMETSPNKNYDRQTEELKALFEEAKTLTDAQDTSNNLKLTALTGLFDGSKKLFVHAESARDIIDAVQFLRQASVEHIVLVGAADAWVVADFLAERQIPVILESLHRRPVRAGEPIDLPFRLPAILHAAGIKVALGYRATTNARNLGFVAGTAAAHGLSPEVALSMITRNTSEILGLGETLGTLEAGKDATLFVSRGDALDMRGNVLTLAFIQGRQISLDGRQQQLYERFKTKYSNR